MTTFRHPPPQKTCALLWDESFLWGLMAWRALTEARLPFDLIRSEDVRMGKLSDYAMIFVPGGWAAAKVRSLGNKGQAEIRRFVENGGGYLGICGGAGLATDSHLKLLPVYRTPNTDRVPSFSGPICLTLTDHPLWRNVQTPVFHAWWPPQLHTAGGKDFHVLARYGQAQPDAFSADIRVADGHSAGWTDLEKRYGIFLDPDRLKDKPAVVEGACGQGNVILSLVHFDTPDDSSGAAVLRNLWRYWMPNLDLNAQAAPSSCSYSLDANESLPHMAILNDIKAAVDELISAGERYSLWHRRNDLLLQWRRGVRGMEYSTLAAMVSEIVKRLSCDEKTNTRQIKSRPLFDSIQLKRDLELIRKLLMPFADQAAQLLRLENSLFANNSPSMPDESPDDEGGRFSLRLFGSARHFGGRFKPLIDAIDRLLYRLLKHPAG